MLRMRKKKQVNNVAALPSLWPVARAWRAIRSQSKLACNQTCSLPSMVSSAIAASTLSHTSFSRCRSFFSGGTCAMSSSPNFPSVQGLKIVSGSSLSKSTPQGAVSSELLTQQPLPCRRPALMAFASSICVPACTLTAASSPASSAVRCKCCRYLCFVLVSVSALVWNRLTARCVSNCLPMNGQRDASCSSWHHPRPLYSRKPASFGTIAVNCPCVLTMYGSAEITCAWVEASCCGTDQ
mmetsp:Transcript_8889/g.19366  ORF Transcript_8889/g.19366 Transcript_8889/m.19366 type:complete len:239 (+) Transcript_8889:288-1004(+)